MQLIGYIVTGGGRAMFQGRGGLLYFPSRNRITFFHRRTIAKRAVARTLYDRPTFEQEFGKLNIVAVHPEPKAASYSITVDYRQGVSITRKL